MTPPRPGHVLVIGIDGVRYDTLLESETPCLDAVAARGFLRPVRVNDAAPTISGPGWATIFTGVLAGAHGILDNRLAPNRLAEFPDVVRATRTARPEVDTFVAAGWAPLVSADSGGPLFADGGLLPRSGHADDPVAHWGDLDEQVTVAAEGFLRGHDGAHGSLAVVYLGAPDEVAHHRGVVPVYTRTIEQSDARVGRLAAAVDGRAGAERWTVVVVTDHGHVDAGGHGGDTEQERTAWIAAYGPDVPHLGPEVALEQADVAAQVLASLGVAHPAPQVCAGRPFGAR